MTKPNGFFRDAEGNKSYGRMASFVLAIGGIILALFGKDYGAMLASSFAFYGADKARQGYVEGKRATPDSSGNP